MKEVINILKSIQAESSTLKKKEILKENENNELLKKMVNFLLNPFLITGISTKKLNKNLFMPLFETVESEFGNFVELMEFVFENNTGTDATVSKVQQFLETVDDDEREFYRAVITKSLRLGSDIKTINSVWGAGFIPEWEVQQSYRIDDHELKEGEWFSLSEKLNGVRGTFYNGKIFSRQGKEYFGLDHIVNDIIALGLSDMVVDGELVRKNTEGLADNENFRIGTGIINSDEGDKGKIELVVFDVMPRECFARGESADTYKTRLDKLQQIRKDVNAKNLQNIKIVEILYSGTDQTKILPLLEEVTKSDKEGLMLNKDTIYKRKRHNGILKIKKFYTVDLKILAYEEGAGRLAGVLGSFVVDYKGNTLNVGSGMSDEQRQEFWSIRDQLIGRVIEVKYKEESIDKKTGKASLQFPIFVTLRDQGKEVSYN